ncbi:hypothetical protein KJE20_00051 [Pyrenophora tritici-repentis]|nr:hypothetical protein KJE20_00051 [Pyrenophora tritici-repentis]
MQSGTMGMGRTVLNAEGREAAFQQVVNATACGAADDVV